MYKIIAFDLDCTLLDSDKNIPEENMRALYYAADKGVEIVPATGRIPMSIPQPLLDLPFLHYGIGANGACLFDYRAQQVIDRQEIPVELALRLIDHAHELGVPYDCYMDNCGYVSECYYGHAREFIMEPRIADLFYSNRKPVPCLEEFLVERNTPLQKLQFYFSDMDMRAYELRHLPEVFPELAVTSSVPGNIEFNLASANKGDGLKNLCRILDIPLEDSIAFGDDLNDITMIKKAGMGVAMANAKPEVLAAADMVTLTNNEAGVGHAIFKLI